jgi:hypothetical protein
MNEFADTVAAKRRTFILRLLVTLGCTANESVIASAVGQGGFPRATRDDVRRDLDLFKERGCTTEDWFDDSVRVVSITERGEDAAYGRITVAGIDRSTWRR